MTKLKNTFKTDTLFKMLFVKHPEKQYQNNSLLWEVTIGMTCPIRDKMLVENDPPPHTIVP